jgi:hypothetical protein
VRGVLVEVVVQIGPFVAMAGLIGVLAGIWLLLEDCLPGATRLRPPTG